MNPDQFWTIIDRVHERSRGDMTMKCVLLHETLGALEREELHAFQLHFQAADARAYDRGLWAAAYTLNGGCSDDTFSDFRATLISMGRAFYEAVLADPDALGELDYDEREMCHEGYQYVAHEVAQERFGEDSASPVENSIHFPERPTGADWREEDLPRLLPKLHARLGAGENRAADETPATDEAPVAPRPSFASYAEWKATPLPLNQLLDFLACAWAQIGRQQSEAEIRRGLEEMRNNQEAMRGLQLGMNEMFETMISGHEPVLDPLLCQRGLPTCLEVQLRSTRQFDTILGKKRIRDFDDWDLARRVLASTLPLSAEERRIVEEAMAKAASRNRSDPD